MPHRQARLETLQFRRRLQFEGAAGGPSGKASNGQLPLVQCTSLRNVSCCSAAGGGKKKTKNSPDSYRYIYDDDDEYM